MRVFAGDGQGGSSPAGQAENAREKGSKEKSSEGDKIERQGEGKGTGGEGNDRGVLQGHIGKKPAENDGKNKIEHKETLE